MAEQQQPAPPDADAHAEEIPVTGTALAVVADAPGAGIIRAEDPRDILRKAQQIAEPLKELIESAGLAIALDKRKPDKKHVEVGGWQAAGVMLGALGGQPLHAETVWTRPVREANGEHKRTKYTATVRRFHSRENGGGVREEVTYEVDGLDWEARVEVRTADGRVMGSADGMVGRDEEAWNTRGDYALRSMAETRAESRAYRRAIGWIVKIAGYNPTPAEEMGHTPGADTTNPPSAAAAQSAKLEKGHPLLAALGGALKTLASGNVEAAKAMGAEIRSEFGGIPEAVAKALVIVATAIEAASGQRQDPHGAPTPSGDGAQATPGTAAPGPTGSPGTGDADPPPQAATNASPPRGTAPSPPSAKATSTSGDEPATQERLDQLVAAMRASDPSRVGLGSIRALAAEMNRVVVELGVPHPLAAAAPDEPPVQALPVDAGPSPGSQETNPPPGSVELSDPRAVTLCICPGGLVAASRNPSTQDTDCPVHGIAF